MGQLRNNFELSDKNFTKDSYFSRVTASHTKYSSKYKKQPHIYLLNRKKSQLLLKEFQFRGERVLLLLHLLFHLLRVYYKWIFTVFFYLTWKEIDDVYIYRYGYAVAKGKSGTLQWSYHLIPMSGPTVQKSGQHCTGREV